MIRTALRFGAPLACALTFGLRFIGAASAADKPTIDTGDTAWLLVATCLVLMMNIPGLALFYCGMVRKKNVLATAVQAFAVAALVTVLWFIVGYSLAFTNGGDLNGVIGSLSRAFGNAVCSLLSCFAAACAAGQSPAPVASPHSDGGSS